MKTFKTIPFTPSDWKNDKALRACSVGARGLWIDMICLMHEAHPYGHLTYHDGNPIPPAYLAKNVGATTQEVTEWLNELRENNVFSETGEGIIYSRRMVREHKKRIEGSKGGRAGGGSPNLVGAQRKLGSDDVDKAEVKTVAMKVSDPKAKVFLEPDYTPDDREWLWAKSQDPRVSDSFLKWQTESFIDYWTDDDRKTKRDAAGHAKAWRNWIRNSIFRYGALDSYTRATSGSDGRGTPPKAGGTGQKASRADRYRNVKPINDDSDD